MEQLQNLEPWMIPIFIMAFVTIIVIVSTIGGIIKASIRRKEPKNLSENKEFLNALREFKENMERRVSNLEEIAAGGKISSSSTKSGAEKKRNQSAIEIELDDERQQNEESSESSRLRNMLNQ